MTRVRVAFKLFMPTRPITSSFGKNRDYVAVRELSQADKERLFPGPLPTNSWSYDFGDGWSARIDGRVLGPGEHRPRTDGFAGYDWMVDSIVRHGEIKRPAR